MAVSVSFPALAGSDSYASHTYLLYWNLNRGRYTASTAMLQLQCQGCLLFGVSNQQGHPGGSWQYVPVLSCWYETIISLPVRQAYFRIWSWPYVPVLYCWYETIISLPVRQAYSRIGQCFIWVEAVWKHTISWYIILSFIVLQIHTRSTTLGG